MSIIKETTAVRIDGLRRGIMVDGLHGTVHCTKGASIGLIGSGMQHSFVFGCFIGNTMGGCLAESLIEEAPVPVPTRSIVSREVGLNSHFVHETI